MNSWFIHFTLLNYFSSLITIETHVLPPTQRVNVTNGSEEGMLHFNELTNANHLHNPCSPGRHQEDSRALIEDDITYTDPRGTPGNKLGLGLLRELITKSTFLQGLATNIIRMNLIEECTTLRLPYVANVPTFNELKSQTMIESLRSLYISLTNQTAHVFFIWDQQQSYISHNCSSHTPLNISLSNHNSRDHSKLLAEHYWTIGVNLRDLMCLFDYALTAFNIDLKTKEATDKVLSHSVTDTSICSRKAVLDCQIMKSSIVLLENMSDYLRDQTVQLVTSMLNRT